MAVQRAVGRCETDLSGLYEYIPELRTERRKSRLPVGCGGRPRYRPGKAAGADR